MIEGALDQPLGSDNLTRLRTRYDELWFAAIGRIRTGEVELDPVLQARTPDQRRGLTLIARPDAAIRKHVARFLRQLKEVEPEQYYYFVSEFHLTILSMFTATLNPEPFFARIEHYVSAVNLALRKVASIQIEFRGVTASPSTVMIQGFFESDALNDLRDALRDQLRIQNLSDGLDRRYRLETAHMTVARFRAPLRDGEGFARTLEEARQRPFGLMRIRSLSLVRNDWYMSHQALEIVKRYS